MGLLEQAVDALHGYFELGNDRRPVAFATLVASPECPNVYDANCVTRVAAETTADIDHLLAEADVAYSALGHRCFKVDPLTPPPFVARLVVEGYEPSVELQSVLETSVDASARAVPIRPVVDDADWLSVAQLMRMDHVESARKRGVECWPQAITDQMVEQKKQKAPDVQFFVARVDDRDCAFFSAWPGVNGIGKVEDLFTVPSFRHRGIATALMVHAVADARRRGGEVVLIGADVNDTPKLMYYRMGFRPLLLYSSFIRNLTPRSAPRAGGGRGPAPG
jgi:GNAT superfamily N-acetyltransferase